MKVRNLLLKLMFCLMIVFGVQFNANAQVTAIATVGPNTSAPNIQFAGGCGGPFILGTNNAFVRSKLNFGYVNLGVTVNIGPLVGAAACASYQINAAGIWSLVLQSPGGGPTPFQVIDTSSGNLLLQGVFGRAVLHGSNGSSSLALTLYQNSVVYNVANSPLLFGLGPNNGSLSIAILSNQPVPAGANGPAAFWANGDINFGAWD